MKEFALIKSHVNLNSVNQALALISDIKVLLISRCNFHCAGESSVNGLQVNVLTYVYR